MNKYKWCGPRMMVSGPSANLTIHKIDYSEGCLNWTCDCGHIKDDHHWLSDKCCECECRSFKYLNNNNCDIDCVFQRKLCEIENK